MRKRILQLIPSFHSGGSERQAVNLTRMLRDEGSFEVMAATLNKEGVLLSEFVNAVDIEVPEYKLRSFYDRNFILQVRRFADHLRKARIDLIHTHDFYTNVFGMAAATLAKTPIRITSKRESDGLRSRAQDLVEKIAFGRASGILVNSNAVIDHLSKQGIANKKFHLIYNGTNIERFQHCDSSESINSFILPAPANSRLISLVANLRHTVKNVAMFIRVAQRVAAFHPDVHFVVAGEGELLPELKKLSADLLVADRVHFLGRCDNIPALLNASYACVLTSTAEGFSNSIIEYMAAGKPVVATNVGGASEAIQDPITGYLVDPGDDKSMAERLIELLNDESKAINMGEAGKAVAVERFSIRTQLANVVGLYEGLLEN